MALFFFMFNVDRIRLLNNKFRGGVASLSFDQGVPKKLPTTAPPSRLEHHLMVFYIDQIVPGFVVYYLNGYYQQRKVPNKIALKSELAINDESAQKILPYGGN